MSMRLIKKNISIFLILIVSFSLYFCKKQENTTYKVVEINDGDTVTLVMDKFLGLIIKTERVRLIGIDAPELGQQPWGRRAKNYLRNIIKESDWQVRIELDVQHRDKYGRILAYLWDKKGNMINYLMVRNGYALVYTIPPNVKYSHLLLEAQRLARQEKLGIWGKEGLKESPSDWRKETLRY